MSSDTYPIIIGIAGGSCSAKTDIAEYLRTNLSTEENDILVVYVSSFYKESRKEKFSFKKRIQNYSQNNKINERKQLNSNLSHEENSVDSLHDNSSFSSIGTSYSDQNSPSLPVQIQTGQSTDDEEEPYYPPIDNPPTPSHPDYNFDHPGAINIEFLLSVLKRLKKGKNVMLPHYDMTTRKRIDEYVWIENKPKVVILEGIFALYWAEVRSLLDLKVFAEVDDDVRLTRRIARDTAEGRDLHEVLRRWLYVVKPSHEIYIKPCQKYTDLIIPRGLDNTIACESLLLSIKQLLKSRNKS